jgi:hypothetical protein
MKRMLVLFMGICLGLPLHLHGRKTEEKTEKLPNSLFYTIQDDLKKPEYIQEILPNNFSYLMQLLQHGKKTQQGRAYPRALFRMFGNMLKGAPCVNAYEYGDRLAELPIMLKDYFILFKSQEILVNKTLTDLDLFDRYKETVATLLFTKFNSHYDYFKQDPEKFLDELSHQIVAIAEEEVSIEQLRQSVIRFLEIGLGKLVWSPDDKEKVWESVKTIAHRLAGFMEYNIIDDVNDLDDLFWALTHRFCYILDLVGNELPIEFYEQIKHDLATQQLLLLELEEQEEFLETKANCLLRSVLVAEARRRTRDSSIIVPQA